MKQPQCNTPAECLRELARVMEQFGIFNTTDAINSCYVKYCGKSSYGMRNLVPDFFTPSDWQFAIAEVEGKPVFVGDEMYDEMGLKLTVTHFDKRIHLFDVEIRNTISTRRVVTWNPPKPETVMLYLRREVAECLAYGAPHEEAVEACKKALEQIK